MTGNRINLTENVLKRLIAEELHNVIHKKGNKWHIRGHHGDWNAEYDSKADAEKGLKASPPTISKWIKELKKEKSEQAA